MVLNYSVNKKDLQAHRPQLESALGEFHRARQLLLGLMVEDQEAYTALTAAKKQGVTGDAFTTALLASIRVPQAIATTALALLELCDKLVDKVNPYLLSDLAVCTDLAVATIRCASYNIRANLPDVAEPAERKRYEQSAAQLVRRGIALVNQVSPRIWKQVAGAT